MTKSEIKKPASRAERIHDGTFRSLVEGEHGLMYECGHKHRSHRRAASCARARVAVRVNATLSAPRPEGSET